MNCPLCGEQMQMMYGCGQCYDYWICTSQKGKRLSDVCPGEIELNVSTYPKEESK